MTLQPELFIAALLAIASAATSHAENAQLCMGVAQHTCDALASAWAPAMRRMLQVQTSSREGAGNSATQQARLVLEEEKNIHRPHDPSERGVDPHQDKLQSWFQEALPKVTAEWNGQQERLHAEKLKLVHAEDGSGWQDIWNHACQNQSEPVLGPIPRHFHFVLFEERGAWINSSHPYSLISADSPAYKNLTQLEQLLIENVRNTLVINNASSVHFLDTAACESATSKISQALLDVYRHEADLRFRSDICRVAALYWEGGYYFDDDMVAYRPIVPLIHDSTEFASVKAVESGLFFQSFIAASPCHPVLRRNLEMFIEARRPDAPKKYDNLLGPVTLQLAYDELQPKKAQLFQESRYDPRGVEPSMLIADYNGFECEFAVHDEVTRNLLFCSRI